MSLINKILDEHEDLLNAKGYNGKNLNSQATQSWLIRELRIHFLNARNVKEREVIELKLSGFFDGGKNTAVFKFTYEYDPAGPELRINRLVANMGGKQEVYEPRTNGDLPSASEVYRELSRVKKWIKKTDQSLNPGPITTNRKNRK